MMYPKTTSIDTIIISPIANEVLSSNIHYLFEQKMMIIAGL